MPETVTLLVSCPDQKGLVSGISNFIFRNGGNILQSDQYTDVEAGIFLARFEFHHDGFQVPPDQIVERFRPLAQEFAMKFEVHFSDHIPKVALFASRLPHCLEDLLQRQQAGEFKAEIAVVVSNHPDAGAIASRYGVPFLHFPISPENKKQQEAEELRELHSRGDRADRAGPLHAGPERRLHRRLPQSHYQYPSFVPARLRGRQALPSGLSARE